jgi:hypothetical protein
MLRRVQELEQRTAQLSNRIDTLIVNQQETKYSGMALKGTCDVDNLPWYETLPQSKADLEQGSAGVLDMGSEYTLCFPQVESVGGALFMRLRQCDVETAEITTGYVPVGVVGNNTDTLEFFGAGKANFFVNFAT